MITHVIGSAEVAPPGPGAVRRIYEGQDVTSVRLPVYSWTIVKKCKAIIRVGVEYHLFMVKYYFYGGTLILYIIYVRG